MSKYLIGIDLGTTNTVVAYSDNENRTQGIRLFEIEQLVAPGEIAARPQLPSMRFHPAPGELAPADIRLPWAWEDPAGMQDAVLGGLAHDLGAQVPGRLVASAKSWLSHPAADRTAAILPWGAHQDVHKVSPLAASAGYLAHVRTAWNHAFPDHSLERQEVVLTVPASFDDAARALTVEAAKSAGIPKLLLLEEPQAAFYDWLFRHRDDLEGVLDGVRLALVCDVGGGTTDLTLIKVEQTEQAPCITRVGVGDHLMLGGDNMDLGLAHLAEGRIAARGVRLSAARLSQLIQQCRLAKERLLAAAAPDRVKVTVLGAGTGLIGGARSAELSRAEAQELVCDGFFPRVGAQERPRQKRGGLVEFGLPYAADPAVSRHVAAFLAQHQAVAREALGDTAPPEGELAVPDAILLNGGVFRSRSLAERLVQTLGDWRGAPLRLLANEHPEWAVARGAVAYGLARYGEAPHIGGGSARSYFLALEERDAERRGVCLLPRRTETGKKLPLEGRSFALGTGWPVRFHLFSSTADTDWTPGDLVELERADLLPLPPIATVLQAKTGSAYSEIPVRLAAVLTEVGTLEVVCEETGGGGRSWRLEFQLRGARAQVLDQNKSGLHPRFSEAAHKIEQIYGRRSQKVTPKDVRRLRGDLEKLLRPREQWDSLLLRELFGALWEGMSRRRRSDDHERIWFNLSGYCLRPGFGYPLDDWRVEQLWSLYGQGVQFTTQARNWAEWWILWRRAAGGLDESAQCRLLDDIAFYLQPPGRALVKRPPGPKRQGYDDMVRLAASLERVPVERRTELGGWLLERLAKPKENPQTWWAVARLASREPIYGSVHNVVPTPIAEDWLERMLALDWKRTESASFAAAMLARRTGDRSRDLDEQLRERVAGRLAAAKAPATWVRMVREVVTLEAAVERRVLGDSLPQGLRLVR